MTKAAEKFISEIQTSWDSLDPWEATAEKGLAEYDRDVLKGYAKESGENYKTVAAEALEAIREHVIVNRPQV